MPFSFSHLKNRSRTEPGDEIHILDDTDGNFQTLIERVCKQDVLGVIMAMIKIQGNAYTCTKIVLSYLH